MIGTIFWNRTKPLQILGFPTICSYVPNFHMNSSKKRKISSNTHSHVRVRTRARGTNPENPAAASPVKTSQQGQPQDRDVSEKQIEKAITAHAKKQGWLSWKLVCPSTAGVPDRIILKPGGKAVFIEVKAPGQKPRPLQRRRLNQLRQLGFTALVIDSLDQIGAI